MGGKIPIVLLHVRPFLVQKSYDHNQHAMSCARAALVTYLERVQREMMFLCADQATMGLCSEVPHPYVTYLAPMPQPGVQKGWGKLMRTAHAGLCYWDGESDDARKFRDYAARMRFPTRLFFSNPLLELVYYADVLEGA